MIDLFAVSVGAAGSLMAYLVYERVTGCRGGHVWGEWEETSRIRTVPYGSKPSVRVEQQHRRECERDTCTASETEYESITDEVYADSVEIDVVERRSRCPSCGEVFPESHIPSRWVNHFDGGERFQRCPECEVQNSAVEWERVPYEEVDDE